MCRQRRDKYITHNVKTGADIEQTPEQKDEFLETTKLSDKHKKLVIIHGDVVWSV